MGVLRWGGGVLALCLDKNAKRKFGPVRQKKKRRKKAKIYFGKKHQNQRTWFPTWGQSMVRCDPCLPCPNFIEFGFKPSSPAQKHSLTPLPQQDSTPKMAAITSSAVVAVKAVSARRVSLKARAAPKAAAFAVSNGSRVQMMQVRAALPFVLGSLRFASFPAPHGRAGQAPMGKVHPCSRRVLDEGQGRLSAETGSLSRSEPRGDGCI